MGDSDRGNGIGSRRESAERTRRLIVSAARDLFARNGFRGTSIADIAEAAKLAPGTIYLHFSSKADLLATVIQETRSPPLPNMAEFTATPRRELFATVARMVAVATEERAEFLMSLSADAVRRPETRSDFYGATLASPFRSAAELIRGLPECAGLPEADVTAFAHILLNACIFTTIEQTYLGGAESDPVDADRMSQIVGTLAEAALASMAQPSGGQPSGGQPSGGLSHPEDSPPATRKQPAARPDTPPPPTEPSDGPDPKGVEHR